MNVLLVSCSCPEPSTPSLGVTSIASWLHQNGMTVEIFDDGPYMLDIADEMSDPRELILSVERTDMSELHILPFAFRMKDFQELLLEFKPDIIGVSSTEATYHNALEYLEACRLIWPAAIRLIGGPFSILASEYPLSQSCVDMVATGEGELTLLDMCKRLQDGQSPYLSPGIAYRGADGQVIRNPVAEPFDIELLEPLKYDLYAERRLYRPIGGAVRRMLPLEVSRGCVYGCTFCASPEYKRIFNDGKYWIRQKSVEAIRRDIEYYCRVIKPEYFFIISETFLAVSGRYLDDFINMYEAFQIPFWMNTRPETIREESISRLKAVGLQRMSVGVECGNEDYRKEHLNRHYSNKQLIEAFDILHRHQIQVTANVMIGLPNETKDMMDESVRLVKVLRPTSVGLAIFQPYKGTKLYQDLVRDGRYDPDKILDATCYHTNHDHAFLTDKQILNYMYTFNLRVRMDESEWSKCDGIDLGTDQGWEELRALLSEYGQA